MVAARGGDGHAAGRRRRGDEEEADHLHVRLVQRPPVHLRDVEAQKGRREVVPAAGPPHRAQGEHEAEGQHVGLHDEPLVRAHQDVLQDGGHPGEGTELGGLEVGGPQRRRRRHGRGHAGADAHGAQPHAAVGRGRFQDLIGEVEQAHDLGAVVVLEGLTGRLPGIVRHQVIQLAGALEGTDVLGGAAAEHHVPLARDGGAIVPAEQHADHDGREGHQADPEHQAPSSCRARRVAGEISRGSSRRHAVCAQYAIRTR